MAIKILDRLRVALYASTKVFKKYSTKNQDCLNFIPLSDYFTTEGSLSVLGMKASFQDNGYICLGKLFGGLIVQWGHGKGMGYEGTTTTYFPIKFPNKCFIVLAGTGLNDEHDRADWIAQTLKRYNDKFITYIQKAGGGYSSVYPTYIAIGY